MDTVEARLTALERKVSRYRNASVLLLVVLAGVVLVGATTDDGIQDVVKTNKLEVINDHGVTVALLTALPFGGGLAFYNSEGETRVILGANPNTREGGLLQIYNEEEESIVELRQGEGGGGYIKLLPAADGRGRATIGFREEGEPYVLLLGKKEGKPNAFFKADYLGFRIYGQNQIEIGLTDLGGMAFFSNKTGEEVVQIYVDDYGNGVVGAYNRKGKGRTLKPGP